ncbi:beta-N-acetylhexosaminidase [Thiomicrorhabdus aquaedulcis]|uniref:beta-N-acetylhexosaminidase n=1 Tax=Thiomicrorhabdus aquaedulcis TaxID=2211106 RepID=UPI000FD9C897|nr:beta-N-acetylhexosaminidase [Thiomicrorhabdus aquaedulcis]
MHKVEGKALSLGSIMIDVAGTELTHTECERLLDPLVAGVILFSRNFESIEQLTQLTQHIHALRHPRLLIGVDHEGGRVQRFKTGFTRLPPMRLLGELYDQDPKHSLEVAQKIGWLLASELLAVGVDFSFAPVVDLDYGESTVIGDRALHRDPLVVGNLAFHLMLGMRKAGMASVAKHFPGHGFISADTHTHVAVDERPLNDIVQHDVQPFLRLIENGLDAVMPAHVVYSNVDRLPAGFSNYWLQTVLRKQCHFEGAIISDDMSMQAAVAFGGATQRVLTALQAGCDLVLVCNQPNAVDEVLANLNWHGSVLSHARLIRLHAHNKVLFASLKYDPLWQAAVTVVNQLNNEYEQKSLLV